VEHSKGPVNRSPPREIRVLDIGESEGFLVSAPLMPRLRHDDFPGAIFLIRRSPPPDSQIDLGPNQQMVCIEHNCFWKPPLTWN
jgi:hypothetical protein